MKTAEEKAAEFVDNYDLHYQLTDSSEAQKGIVKLLKQQDRDTRHACAAAVAGDGDYNVIPVDDAQQIIMNTKAV